MPFLDLSRPSLTFHCLSLTLHCLSSTFRFLSSTFHCLSLTFRCLSSTFRCRSLPFRCLSSIFHCHSSTFRCRSSTFRRLSLTVHCICSRDGWAGRQHGRQRCQPRQWDDQRYECLQQRCLSLTFHCTLRCLSLTFHRPCHVFPLPFHCLSAAFPLPFCCLVTSSAFHCRLTASCQVAPWWKAAAGCQTAHLAPRPASGIGSRGRSPPKTRSRNTHFRRLRSRHHRHTWALHRPLRCRSQTFSLPLHRLFRCLFRCLSFTFSLLGQALLASVSRPGPYSGAPQKPQINISPGVSKGRRNLILRPGWRARSARGGRARDAAVQLSRALHPRGVQNDPRCPMTPAEFVFLSCPVLSILATD